MSIRDWQRHGDTNVGIGMAPSRKRDPIDEIRELRQQLKKAERQRDEAMALLSDLRCVIFVEHGLRPGYGWDDYVARIDAALKEKA